MFYSTIGAEFLRIARATSRLDDLISSLNSLVKRMLQQGADANVSRKTLHNVVRRHNETFIKYECDIKNTIDSIFT